MTDPLTPDAVAALLEAATPGPGSVVIVQHVLHGPLRAGPLYEAAPSIARAYVEQAAEIERLRASQPRTMEMPTAAAAMLSEHATERDALRAEVDRLRGDANVGMCAALVGHVEAQDEELERLHALAEAARNRDGCDERCCMMQPYRGCTCGDHEMRVALERIYPGTLADHPVEEPPGLAERQAAFARALETGEPCGCDDCTQTRAGFSSNPPVRTSHDMVVAAMRTVSPAVPDATGVDAVQDEQAGAPVAAGGSDGALGEGAAAGTDAAPRAGADAAGDGGER